MASDSSDMPSRTVLTSLVDAGPADGVAGERDEVELLAVHGEHEVPDQHDERHHAGGADDQVPPGHGGFPVGPHGQTVVDLKCRRHRGRCRHQGGAEMAGAEMACEMAGDGSGERLDVVAGARA
jgi:hypothetical protein